MTDIELLDDIELLGLAAKAADIYEALHQTEDGFVFIGSYVIWNPIADDGDALRLAVRLRSYGVIISLVSVAQVEVLALRCDSPY